MEMITILIITFYLAVVPFPNPTYGDDNAITSDAIDDIAESANKIDTAIDTVTSALAYFGSVAKQIEVQADFTQGLVDQLNIGIGTLVDADMAQESAMLQSLQIKQNLGTQALGIANAAPQTILGLFG